MNIFDHNRIQELIDNGYDFDIGAYFSEGMELVKKEAGLFIGYTVVYFLIAVVASMIPMASVLVGAPLVAGFFLGAHKVSRNEILEFGDFFKGFDYFAQLLIQQLILVLIMIVVMIPLFIIFGTSIFLIAEGGLPDAGIGIVGILVLLLVFIGIFYITVSYVFAPLFILFGDMQAWDAMEASRKIVGKNFFPILGLVLLLALVNIIGMIPCGLGLLFTMPLSYAALYVAFRELLRLDDDSEAGGDILDHLVD